MSIFVGNLAYEITEKDLTDVFAEYGTVQRVHIPVDRETGNKRGFAFVEMESKTQEESAIAALDGADWMGREMKVNQAREREQKSGSFNGGGGAGRRQKRF